MALIMTLPLIALSFSSTGLAQASASTNASPANIEKGKKLFTSTGCITCHSIEGKGGKVGPDLTQEAKLGRSSEWLITQIRDPAKHDPNTMMPGHKELSRQQLNDLVDYLLHPSARSGAPTGPGPGSPATNDFADLRAQIFPGSRKNPVPANPQTIAAGKRIYEGQCEPCHGPKGKGNGSASIALRRKVSDLSSPVMAEYTDGALYDVITQGRDSMPRFKSLLTEQQRWEVLNYIRTLAPKLAALAPAAAPAVVRAGSPQPAGLIPGGPAQNPDPLGAPTPIHVSAQASAPDTNASPANIEKGKKLFTSTGCITCHTIEGRGGKVGPDLTREAWLGRSREWLITQIRDPAKHDPKTMMPAHKELSQQQLNDLANYILNPAGKKT